LHYATIHNNLELAKKIYEMNPKMCIKSNFRGETPFHLAVKVRSLDILTVFEAHK
jgi:hypothetical protein